MDILQINWPVRFKKCQGHKRQRKIKEEEAKETLQLKANCDLVLSSKPEK